MRVLGASLARAAASGRPVEHTLVLLDPQGTVQRLQRVGSLPAAAGAVAQLAAGEPFVLGLDLPVIPGRDGARGRPVDVLLRRRLGLRPPAPPPAPPAGPALLASLAAAGQPCLTYPDRDRRRCGLAEVHPELVLKVLLWETSPLAAGDDSAERQAALFRALAPAAPRGAAQRADWPARAASLDLLLRALGTPPGFDPAPAREALTRAGSDAEVEAAASALDAALIAGTVRRYLEAPETCLFLGDVEHGYVILPADALVRRLARTGRLAPAPRLFPQTSLRERLGEQALLRSTGLLEMPGRPPRLEATFRLEPLYEFDNLDEMLWWKHARHLGGPLLPTEGLAELQVVLDRDPPEGAGASLRLLRSRHRTLSFRFEPAEAWRARCPTRDGRTYPFRVVRALYETLPGRP